MDAPLSDEQRRALRVAVMEEYFEAPRRTTLNELGDRLSLSDAETSRVLRRALSAHLRETVTDSVRRSLRGVLFVRFDDLEQFEIPVRIFGVGSEAIAAFDVDAVRFGGPNEYLQLRAELFSRCRWRPLFHNSRSKRSHQ